jgi:hypothetical protein
MQGEDVIDLSDYVCTSSLITATMDILPIELLQHILTFGPPRLPIEDRYTPYAPLAVSKRWRDAALAFPLLWTEIDLSLVRWMEGSLQPKLIKLIEIWLQRSSKSGIFISLDTRHWWIDSGDIDLNICHLLVDHIARWRTFTYIGPGHQFLDHIYERLSDAMRLSCLSLHRTTFGRIELKSYAPHSGFGPSLPLLTLNLNMWPVESFPRIGGETLTTLRLTDLGVPCPSFYRLVDGIPNITQLELDRTAVYPNSDTRPMNSRNTLSNLKRIRFNTEQVGNLPGSDVGSMARLVLQIANRLEEMEIHFRSRHRYSAIVEVDTFQYWVKFIPNTVAVVWLVYSLFEGAAFNRDTELQLSASTNHLNNLRVLHVKTLDYRMNGIKPEIAVMTIALA